ncbi:hypothetical protein BC943DRAFT_329921 [Umbelopsis sp. AD052]|nr:hypothetical protein BC943DRAFT_329921 [Umbelopsis sp. AD052]
MKCIFPHCDRQSYFRSQLTLRRHLRKDHALSIKDAPKSGSTKKVQEPNDMCIYYECPHSIVNLEIYQQHLMNQHNIKNLLDENLEVTSHDVDSIDESSEGTRASSSGMIEPQDLNYVAAEEQDASPVALASGTLNLEMTVIPPSTEAAKSYITLRSASRSALASSSAISEPPVSPHVAAEQSDSELLNIRSSKRRRVMNTTVVSTSALTGINQDTSILQRSRNKGKGKEGQEIAYDVNDYTLDRPKLTGEQITDMGDKYLLGISAAISDDVKQEYESNIDDGDDLKSLSAILKAKDFLITVLDAENPSKGLKACFEMFDLSTYDGQFLASMRATLFDFCSMSSTNSSFKYSDNHERTFWIESIVPIFKFFGRITDLVTFKWCETSTKSRAIATMAAGTVTSDTVRFVDGLGSSDYGETVVMESSSGPHVEDAVHTSSDTVKLLKSAIEMLKVHQREFMDADFATLSKRKILTVQTVRHTMTLSSVSLTDDDKKYKYIQLRWARVPSSWKERDDWLRMFEFLAHMMEILRAQKEVHVQLCKERSLRTPVRREDTVRKSSKAVHRDDSPLFKY